MSLRHIGLTGLQRVHGDISLRSLGSLQKIEFPALETVEGDLVITSNGDLRTLDLSSLQQVHGKVDIRANGCISDESVLAMLDGVTVDGLITVGGNGRGEECW